MRSPKPRLLSDAEIEIWLKVASTVEKRPGATLPRPTPKAEPASSDRKDAAEKAARTPRIRVGIVPSYSPPVSQPKPAAPPLAPFEKRYRQKVAHGRVEIDRVIDLHGLTQAQAHGALIGFLRSSHLGGARLVLVVTGKGRSRLSNLRALGEAETGVLRRMVPFWLRATDLRSIVMGFEEASLPHGGMGALYVRLRRADLPA